MPANNRQSMHLSKFKEFGLKINNMKKMYIANKLGISNRAFWTSSVYNITQYVSMYIKSSKIVLSINKDVC